MNETYSTNAISFIAKKSSGPPVPRDASITLHFHPDIIRGDISLIDAFALDGVYRSQFETKTSSGGLSAHKSGRRWDWESRMFGGAYDNAPAALRPKYGSYNYSQRTIGGSPRFGSSYFRLKSHTICKTTFAYPDSHLAPTNFGCSQRMGLVTLAQENATKLDPLDDYIEAHVHDKIDICEDVEAIVLDPSYRGTQIEQTACSLPISVEWHDGFGLASEHLEVCAEYRGQDVAEFLRRFDVGHMIRPVHLGEFRDGCTDPQLLKMAWHCIARFGASL